jgi:hypothetical protein
MDFENAQLQRFPDCAKETTRDQHLPYREKSNLPLLGYGMDLLNLKDIFLYSSLFFKNKKIE